MPTVLKPRTVKRLTEPEKAALYKGQFFHTHVHSSYSTLDGMTPVADLVAKAHKYKQPAMALTDHGVMSGVFQLYTECRKRDMLPFPGVELYVVDDISDPKADRYHMTAFAFTTAGYKALVNLVTISHQRDHYHYKPRVDMADLIEWADAYTGEGSTKGADGVMFTTGCYFGKLIQSGCDAKDGAKLVTNLAAILPNLLIEYQHHDTAHTNGPFNDDDEVVRWLREVQKIVGLPAIVTQDCHYLELSHAPLHSRMKQMAYGATDPGDVGFPGDGYHLSSATWVKSHFEAGPMRAIWDDALDTFDDLLERHTLSIPQLDKYRYSVPVAAGFTGDPQKKLAAECEKAMRAKGLWTKKRYRDRLRYELDVIKQLGFADYFWLVGGYCVKARSKGIYIMARGSANGCLVCWLMDITDLDPVKWKLSFDRFLTLDRERPPDIDMDIEDDRRAEVIADIGADYDMKPLATYGQLGISEDGVGGTYVTWMSSRRRAMDKDSFNRRYGAVRSLHDLRKLEPDVVDDLIALTDPVHRAKGIHLLKQPGVHAAGYIISSDDLKIDEWIPGMLIASSGTIVASMTMDDAENVGFVKVDLLGLRSLRTLRRTVELVAEHGPTINHLEIPLNEAKVYSMLRKGREMTGVFQMEGYAAAKGCRQLGVRNINDMILVNALYRPASKDAGYTHSYLLRRRKQQDVSYPHEVFEPHMKETLGVPVYQEQVLDVMRSMGMDPVSINKLLKAIKRSGKGAADRNDRDFADSRDHFFDLCRDVDMMDEQMEQSWHLVEGFARYGFNRAHSTAYSLLGYRLAWFKVMYPLDFHSALLETTVGAAKHDLYIKEVRQMQIPILPPDVNVSGPNWTPDRRRSAIRRGLSSIKGVGNDASIELWANSPYVTIDDIIEKCTARVVTGGKRYAKDGVLNGVLETLRQAGALKSIGVE